MIDVPPLPPFQPHPPDAAGVLSWAHLGDLHMTLAGEQNHLDLLLLIQLLNTAFAPGLSFTFLPGDVADSGSAAQYTVVRQALDTLDLPWCAIIGDHDIHEKSFSHFLQFMAPATHVRFRIGDVCFFALNAFDVPDPGSFAVLSAQLEWLEAGLRSMSSRQSAVLFLHCYPTDLKVGGGELTDLLSRFPVRLVEMGHTHYNELSNDGHILFAATRSTGQIEEGPVGFSVTNLDGPVVSWRFLPLHSLPAVIITSPADERLITAQHLSTQVAANPVRVRAKTWSTAPMRRVTATLAGNTFPLERIADSAVWQGELTGTTLPDGVHTLLVTATDDIGRQGTDSIRIVLGTSAYLAPERHPRDQDNALPAWPEHGLLGTQLGPNKHGRKW